MKWFLNVCRVGLSVMTAFLITQAFNIFTPVTAFCRAVLKIEVQSIFQYWWSWAVHHLVVRYCLGARLEVCAGSQLPTPTPGVQDIFVVNHTPTPLLPSLFYYVRSHYSKRLMAVVKIELVRNILWGFFFGWAMWGMWGAVFIDRRNTEQAYRAIKLAVERFAGKMPFLIFADQSRPTKKKIAADREKFRAVIPNIDQWLTHTLVPRTGGTFKQIEAIDRLRQPNGERYKVRLIVVVCWSSRASSGVLEGSALVGSTLYVNVLTIEDDQIPRTAAGLAELFNNLWMWINALLAGAENASSN